MIIDGEQQLTISATPGCLNNVIAMEKTMKSLFATAAIVAVFSLSAVGAQAQNETDRAIGAGSYLHPNGPAKGFWTTTPQGSRLMGFEAAQRKV